MSQQGSARIATTQENRSRFLSDRRGTGAGKEWLRSLDAEDRKVIGEDIATVEYGWPVGMPKCRSSGQGLWEVRSTLRNNRISRVIFGIVRSQMVLLHGFIKKTQQTSDEDLSLACQRLKEIER